MALSRTDMKGIRIALCVLSAFMFLGSMAVYAKWDEKQYSEETLCPKNGEHDVAFLLVDKTDPWEKDEIPRVEAVLNEVKDSLGKHERLYIFILDKGRLQNKKTIFSLCNPGQGRQWNPFNNNQRRRQEYWNSSFGRPFEEIIELAKTPGQASSTYLLELLQHIKELAKPNQRARVFLISDMMQHSGLLSLYGNFSGHSEQRGAMPNLDFITEATVFFIDRPNLSQRKKSRVKTFWQDYLNAAGTKVEWRSLLQ